MVVVAGQSREVVLELVPLPRHVEPTPSYKRWWLWTGAGAVLVGGAALIIYATRPQYDTVIEFRR